MKKTISKKIEISAVFALALAFALSFASFNFVLADNASSGEYSSSSEKLEQNVILGRPEIPERLNSAKRSFDQNKNREEMLRKAGDKKAEIERNMVKMKDVKDHLDFKSEERKTRFGTTTFSTSTVGISSTTPFRKRELEKIKKESEKIAERFFNNMERLEDFYGRISEKVRKLEKKSVSVDDVKSLLGIARLKIDSAKSDVDNLRKVMSEGIGDQNKKDYFELIKNLSIKAKDSIRGAQEALSNAVKSLKPGFNKDKNASSSSSEISSVSSSPVSSATSSNSSSL